MAVLEHQIRTELHARDGAAPNNLESRLPNEGTDLVREVAKDPLIFDFLGLTAEAQEHAMEEAMTLRLQQTLAEFGTGFAFVGRQHHLDIDGDDFYNDLLLYHVPSDRYVAAVYVMIRRPRQSPSVGILVCGSKMIGPCVTPWMVLLVSMSLYFKKRRRLCRPLNRLRLR